MAPVTQLDLDSWRSAFDNNVVATMLTLKYAAREMVRAGGGSFVAISSISSTMAARFTSPISSAKAAVDQLCRIAASELGPSNVRVNVVRPGLVRVDRQELPEQIERDFRSAVVLRRLGRPGDIADMVSFLVGPRAAWITGQVISVDGGQTVNRPFDASAWVEPVYGQDGMRGVV
jgi:NAD(P)-dependent dehydrogenase (short-subunit alcohol dehydrogenase family)